MSIVIVIVFYPEAPSAPEFRNQNVCGGASEFRCMVRSKADYVPSSVAVDTGQCKVVVHHHELRTG